MKRMSILATCILLACGHLYAGDFDKKKLKEMVKKLGEDNFRERRKAQKTIIAELETMQKSYLETLAKIDAGAKESDALKTLGTTLKDLMTILEETGKSSEDPEVQMRLKKIFSKTFPSKVYEQKIGHQKLIVAEFKNTVLSDRRSDGKTANLLMYFKNGAAVVEICDLRIIRLGLKKSNFYSRSGSLPLDYNGDWESSRGNSFSFKATAGKTTCKWQDWTFVFKGTELSIGGKKIPVGKGKNVIIVDEKGVLKCHIPLAD